VATASLRRFEHELALSDQLHPTWAAKPIALGYYRSQSVLVLSDPGGAPLSRFTGKPLELTLFLKCAIGLTAAIRHMHERGLIHRDIRPANVFANESAQVWLTASA
jgi:serine/threonine protein kinase